MKIWYVCWHDYFLHMHFALWVKNFNPNKLKNSTKWPKKNHFPWTQKLKFKNLETTILKFYNLLSNPKINLSKSSYDILCYQMHPLNMAKHRCKPYLFIIFMTSIALFNAFFFIPFIKRYNLDTWYS
jgi:hypothetical protein